MMLGCCSIILFGVVTGVYLYLMDLISKERENSPSWHNFVQIWTNMGANIVWPRGIVGNPHPILLQFRFRLRRHHHR